MKRANAEWVALEEATVECKAEAKGMKFGLTLSKAPETRPDGRTKPENGDVIRCVERASPAYRCSSTPRADRTERRSCLQGLTSEIVYVLSTSGPVISSRAAPLPITTHEWARSSSLRCDCRPLREHGHRCTSMSDPLRRNPITGIAVCCARATSGHAAATPRSVMNSRRLNSSNCIRSPASQGRIAGYRIGKEQSGCNKTILQSVTRCASSVECEGS